MGIYSAKFALESGEVTAASAIQTPDDIGVDLDQVEKNVMGDDGIEASREEIEAAQSGLVGEPLEEAYMIMYESQYNYNQIMHTIGVHELREAASGREFVLEAADKKGFFTRIKEILVRMFEGITKAFKKVAQLLSAAFQNDKKLVEKHKKAIEEGAATDWTAKGFVFAKDITLKDITNAAAWATEADSKLKEVKEGKAPELKDREDLHKEVISTISGTDADNVSDMTSELFKALRGGSDKVVELNKDNVKASDIIDILKADSEAKAIKETYNKIKGSYKEALAQVTKLEKAITASEYDNISNAFAVCEYFTSAITFEKNVQNAAYAVMLRAAKDKRAQARKLAMHFIKKAPVEVKKSVKNESSVFGSITLY